jgi:hypothetical protein
MQRKKQAIQDRKYHFKIKTTNYLPKHTKMKTKMLVLIAGLFLVVTTGIAQTKTAFGIRAGVNFQNLNGEDPDGDDLDYKLKTGFHVGVDVDIPIAQDFYLRPGVLFSTKGAKFDDDADTKINLSYIEVPISFAYKPMLGTGRLILGIGPYVAFAVGGNIKNDDDEVDIEFENEISMAQAISGTQYLKSLDFGGNLFFGYEFSQHFFAQINAQLGLSNITPKIEGVDDDDRGKVKNTGFGLSLGYRF